MSARKNRPGKFAGAPTRPVPTPSALATRPRAALTVSQPAVRLAYTSTTPIA